jgi:hypothetical protein
MFLYHFKVILLMLQPSAAQWATTSRVRRTSSLLYFRTQFSVSRTLSGQYNKKQYLAENYGRSLAALGLKCNDCAVAAC